MSMRHLLVAAGLCAALSWPQRGHAAEDAAALARIVADSTAKYTELFAKRDAAGLAALFTPEAEYVDADGVVFHGREAIQAELAAQFEAGEEGKLEIEVVSIRPIADGLVVEEGASTFRPAVESSSITQSRYIALHMRQADGAWLMAAVRELSPPELTPHEQLKALAWLVGEWREEVDGSVTKSNWRWSDDGVALLAEFTVVDREGNPRSGTHRVGWDAERKQFRSWIFDSQGGSLEGWWAHGLDDSWTVQLQGVDAEGVRIGGALTYVRDGADRLVIEQKARVRGGLALPDVVTRVVRRPPPANVPTK